MTVTFFKEQLDDAVGILGGSVGAKSYRNEYHMIQLVAAEGTARLTTSDVVQTCSLVVACKTAGELNTSIPFNLFRDLLKTYWGDQVTIDVRPENPETIVIQCGGVKTTIPILLGEESFGVDLSGNKVTFPAATLKHGFQSVINSCEKHDASRPALMGVNLAFKEKSPHFIATDGFRISIFIAPPINENPLPDVLLHHISVRNILKMLQRFDPSEVDVYATPETWAFDFGEARLKVNVMAESYPDMAPILKKLDGTPALFTCDRKELLTCIKTTQVTTKNQSLPTMIKLTEDGELSISGESEEVGRVERCMGFVIGETQADSFRINLNGEFLIDALQAIEDNSVSINRRDVSDPVIIRPQGRTDLIHAIMPIYYRDGK